MSTEEQKAVSAKKVGRCFNGAERDKGTIVHLVKPMEVYSSGDWFTKALCGTEPGRRGNGWTKTDQQPTCQKCLSKLQSSIKTIKQ